MSILKGRSAIFDLFTEYEDESSQSEMESNLEFSGSCNDKTMASKDDEFSGFDACVKLPTLARMARDILAAPSEAAFSVRGRVIDESRASMLPETVKALKCQGSISHYTGKEVFWSSWNNRGSGEDIPWLVIGDLNEILGPFEREGGALWNPNRRHYLRSFMNINSLLDIGYKGQRFTWARKQGDTIVLQERLDRCLVDKNWLLGWPETNLTHLTRIGLDHSPILFNTNPILQRPKAGFKFEASWVDEVETAPIIEQCWLSNLFCPNVTTWTTNLTRCKNGLRSWSKNKFPQSNKVEIKKCIEELEELQQHNPFDSSEQQQNLSKKLGSLWLREEKYWHQRSRVKWLTSDDSNSRFFHLSTLHRRQRNRILKIQNDDDVWVIGENLIRMEFEAQFRKVFTSSGNREWGNTLSGVTPLVNPEMNRDLSAPFSLEDVKEAAQQLGALKAPGPDGFAGLFYHKYWRIVKDVIWETSKDFSNGCARLHELNRTHIVLIPKNAFVPERHIQDNIFLAHESYHYLKLKREGDNNELGLKLDMNKAYDMVEWDFLQAALLRFGFKRSWVKLIMACVTTATLLNCWQLKKIFHEYCNASGQLMNKAKSSIYFTPNTSPQMASLMCELLGFVEVDNPETYLGLPTIWGKSKKEAQVYIKERVDKKLEGWKQRSLSLAGREVLIKSVAMAIPTYPMVLKARYFPDCSFFEAFKGYRASWGWSSLLEARDKIFDGFHWQVINGYSINIWSDKWIPPPNTGMVQTTGLPLGNAPMKVNSLIDWENRTWQLDRILHLIQLSEVSRITSIPIGDGVGSDRLIWPMYKTGHYSVGSGYHWLHQKSSTHYVPIDKRVWRAVWKIDTLPKIDTFSLYGLFSMKPFLQCTICT
ncbi:uncharacterized protein LOC133723125 [Rosa rugosa]|uniref:uncharacterized protein LOC133723125 n=1 Tax=Rosa rugosa TaxID=74645 RepID=UPI002B412F53|nr:uncharacterized protein LOC133723125 [Rosa rugosa]